MQNYYFLTKILSCNIARTRSFFNTFFGKPIFSENIILQCDIDLRLSYFGVKSDGNLGTFVFCSYGVWFCIFHKPSEHAGFENFSQNNCQKSPEIHIIFEQKSSIFRFYTAQSRQRSISISAPKTEWTGPTACGGSLFFPYRYTSQLGWP